MRNTFIGITTLLIGSAMPAALFASDIKVTAQTSVNASVQQRVADRTYEVTAKGDRNDSRSEVYDEALYKAAKKTRKEDFDWFRVVDSEIEKETRIRDSESSFEAGYDRVPYRSCGLLTCRTEYRTERRTNVTIDLDDREESRYEVELEFEVGWGPMPSSGEVYDARLTINQYR